MDERELKKWLYRRTIAEARGFGMDISHEHSSDDKPWGAYLRISDSTLPQFYAAYWADADVPEPGDHLKLAPKILIVAPGARLSLQYHFRRREHWRILDGPVTVACGKDEGSVVESVYHAGDVLHLPCGDWHRLIGMQTWGRVAEIWEHTDPARPSDEDDIVRVQDDYGR